MSGPIVVDIEGTTSSISFVKETLFPYARAALPAFLAARAGEPEVARWVQAVAAEAGVAPEPGRVAEVLQRWIDEDRKHTALKALQGMIWAKGYADGEYRAHVYPDAVDALRRWSRAGRPLYVYSSGSVRAQRLFFGHTEAGDLTDLFAGFFDTQVGPKKEPESYRSIVAALDAPAEAVTFLSDVVAELDAAREAGLATVLVDRLEDYPSPRLGEATGGHRRVTSLAELG